MRNAKPPFISCQRSAFTEVNDWAPDATIFYVRDQADWFVKADDDTYMVLENLKHMLQSYDTNMPWYFGCKLKPIEGLHHGYMSGGAGYVLSKKALKRFVNKAQ